MDKDAISLKEDDLLLLNALVDGELDAAATIALERRLATEPKLAAEHDRLKALKAAVQALDRPAVGDDFRARIAGLAIPKPRPIVDTAPVPRGRWPSREWRNIAASIILTAMIASSGTYALIGGHSPPGASLEASIADGHMRSLLATSPVDVVSSDQHTVKPWLDAKLGVSPPAVDLATQGFTLVGGRVDVIDGRVAPSLVYRHNEHLISLVSLPSQAGDPAAADAVALNVGGYHMVRWQGAGFSYWAVSDVEPAKLAEFVKLYRSQTAS